jgi:CNT family concentrative nucleoside transporter
MPRMERLVSLLGLLVMIGLAWLMSSHKRRMPMRVVLGGLGLQFAFAVLILKTEPGQRVFAAIGDFFRRLLDFVDAGSSFVFGPEFQNFYFAFKVLPTIIFFSSLMSVFYYLGVMQRVVLAAAWLMQRTLRTSGAESLSAAANIFVGQTEAPLVIRPYVGSMTVSELNAVMVGGFSTVAGGVLAAYVGMGIDAGHLLTASVISAPAGLLIAKVLQPETEHPKTMGTVEIAPQKHGANLIEAAAVGATEGLRLALNVAAMLIAFLALIAVVDALLGWVGTWFGFVGPRAWSLSAGLSYAFAPLAWLLGIEPRDCLAVGELLGLKMVANEFVAYERFSQWLPDDSPVQLSQRSKAIVIYALCGFSNFGSIGIQIGGIGALAPERQPDLARLGLRAMLGGTLACLMTACVAGVLL